MPMWRYGSAASGVPLGPIVPTEEPSVTTAFRFTPIDPR